MQDLGTILGVWAHPDDEMYLTAGLMAAAVRAGRRVVCVTATRGEGGSLDEVRWPPARLAEIRTVELAESLAILGVTEHVFLDYPDGGCADVPPDEGARRVAAVIEDVAPDTVLTFGPDGITGHSDHSAVSLWTLRAFERSAKQGSSLYYATETPDHLACIVEIAERFNMFYGGADPRVTPPEECAIWAPLEGELLDLKLRAALAQASQTTQIVSALGEDTYRKLLAQEAFVLAATR